MKPKIIIYAMLMGLIAPIFAAKTEKSNCEFVILITSYKNELYAEDNLKSACWQKTTNPYQIIYINDCSPDATGNVVDAYIQNNHLEDRVTVIHNKERVGAMANIYNAIHELISDNKIVVSLDGDDTLAHNNVLETLEKYYADPDLWMTYGSAKRFPRGKADLSQKIPDWVFAENKIRDYKFVSQHLRTFKAGLFKRIKKEDFFYEGKFMTVSWDMAFMLPMLEMSSPKKSGDKNHSIFIDEILYLYRIDNPINDFRVRKRLQKKVDTFIRNKKPYEPIDTI